MASSILKVSLIFLGLLFGAHSIDAAEYNGRVVNIVDGDTFDIEASPENVRVRLCGVDSQERGEPDFRAAKEVLRKLLPGRRCVAFRSAVARPVMVAHAQKIAIESLPSVSWGVWTLQPRWYALTWLAIGRGFRVVIIASVPPLASITDNLSKDADHSATVPIVVHELDDGVVGSVAVVPFSLAK